VCGAPFTPELARSKLRTGDPVIDQQSVGFVRNTGGTARIFPVLLFARAVFCFENHTVKEHKK